MSADPTVVTAALLDYIAGHAAPEDEFLRDLKRAAEAEGIPAIWISPAQAAFMAVLLRLGKVREVVEVGTLAGYSAIAMARALPEDGRVRTVEIEPKHAAFAKRWVAGSDVAGRVEVHVGPGADVLAGFADGSADAAFIDADKAGYPTYLEHALRIVRRGGLILCDNAFAFGKLLEEESDDPSVRAIRAFNDQVAGDDRLQGVIAPVGDGCWVAVKK